MRKHLIRALLVGGAAAAAVALVGGQAAAAGTITITGAGGAISASSTDTVLSDVTSGQSFSCSGSSAGGSLANVTSAPLPYTTTQADGTAHSITSLGFTGCTSSFGTATVSVPAADLPDDLVITATSTTAPQGTGFVESAGTAAPLLAHISVLTCSFDVEGQADATWTNGSPTPLQFTGNGTLTPVNISAGCFGLVNTGDTLTYKGDYSVTPGTINVTP